MNPAPLRPRGKVMRTPGGWRFEIEEGGASAYRLAQLDDYATLARSRFNWREGTTLSLRCRVSDISLPGTWGFGFWNDPFSMSLGLQGMARRLPALPNCAWFFYASPANHLSFAPAQAQKPASGFLAQTFSARVPAAVLLPGVFAAPLLAIKPAARWLRGVAGKWVSEDAQRLEVDVTQWTEYRLRRGKSRVEFVVNGESAFESAICPQGPLGLVIWIDNQYAAWYADGSLKLGVQANPSPAWMEIEGLVVA